VYTNIVRALCKVQGEVLVVYGQDDRQTSTWAEFVYRTRSALERRRDLRGLRLGYTDEGLATLLDEIRDFADLWQKRKSQDLQFQVVPSHMPVQSNDRDSAYTAIIRTVLEHVRSEQTSHSAMQGREDSVLIAAMVRQVMGAQGSVPGHYPVYTVSTHSADLITDMVRGAVVHSTPQSAMHLPIQPDAAATVPTLINAAIE
jgi:hypothetical protein